MFFYSVYITDEGFNALSQALRKMTLLTKLDLNFDGNDEFSSHSFINFSKILKSLKNLSNLKLNFSRFFLEKY